MRIVRFVLALLLVSAVEARANTITYVMDFTFSGTPPSGFPTLTIDDNNSSGVVTFTIDAGGLSGTEFMDDVYFNVNGGGAGLSATYISGVQANGVSFGDNAFKADGDGYFDGIFDYPPPPGGTSVFGAGEQSVYTLSRAGLTAASFNFTSFCETGCGTGSYFAAVHIQSIGATGLSGWNGDGDGNPPPPPPPPPNVVPEPTSMLLLGTGVVGLIARARKRK